jgi:outer membrane receptor for Fe3+-dicitrate
MQAVNTSLIWLDAMTNFEMKLYRFSTQMVSLFEDLKEERGGVRLDKAVMSGMQQEIQFCMNECELRRYQANGLHQRIQTQINLVSS